ncbi:MAG: hypothetical protein H3C43_11240 [Leptonema sp. (in: Bacteria)]|nr:hypothetical protein [Leptonema sp. (in: bacteria)]
MLTLMKNTQRKAILFVLFIFIFSTFSNCRKSGDEALISHLFNQRMIVLLKGTYATDYPLDWAEINNNQLFVDNNDPNDLSNLPAYNQLPLFLDVGELRLSTKGYLSLLADLKEEDDAIKFWDVLSPTRQVYCSPTFFLLNNDNSCFDKAGYINFQELFNGRGATYPSRDVGPGAYQHAGIYVRSFFTGFARQSGTAPINSNFRVNGYPVNLILGYDPNVDSAIRGILPSQWFPLHHITYPGMQNSMFVTGEYIPLGIEIRFNVKENLMVHSFVPADNSDPVSVVGISDWRKPHNGEVDIGGNVLTRARIFYPDFTRTVRVHNGTKSNRHYYAIYYQGECRDQFGNMTCEDPNKDLLPLAATPVRAGSDNRMTYLMPGDYVIQCRYDNVHDGYPEQVLSEKPFSIPQGGGEFDINCQCGGGANDCS